MPDLALNVERAVELLNGEARSAVERVQSIAAGLEKELRAVAATLETGIAFDVQRAASLHVFDLDASPPGMREWPPGAPVEINIGGYSRAVSNLSRALPVGRYRAILQLTRVTEEPER